MKRVSFRGDQKWRIFKVVLGKDEEREAKAMFMKQGTKNPLELSPTPVLVLGLVLEQPLQIMV